MHFVELAAKTNYSFLEGASHPEEIIQRAKELDYDGIAITDRNGVYGAPRAHAAAGTSHFHLIVGSEIVLEKEASLILLAKNRKGYGDLCELLTYLHGEELPLCSLPKLSGFSDHLFALLSIESCEKENIPYLKEIFGARLFLLTHQFLDGKDKFFLQKSEHFSKKHQIPCIASNAPLFHTPARKPLQDVLTCIRHTCTLREGGFRLKPNAERYLKSKQALKELFSTHPEWIERTLEIAEECHFSLNEIRYRYPQEWIPNGETGDSFLEKLVWQGAQKRYGTFLPKAVELQLKHELELIRELQYSDYFLTIWDIVEFAKSQNIVYQGRGSAANSIVCYLLGITAIDPIQMNLLFERFISRERKEPPDIDIDFEHERREEVIQYIYQRYGRHRAAITAEVICYRRKSAFREVAKVFEVPLSVVEHLLTLSHRAKLSPKKWRELQEAMASQIPPVLLKQYFALVGELLGFPRHLGTHVGGFVLCQDTLSRNVPIEKAAMPNRTIVQWDKDDLDTLGFVRVDILGLGILTCLRKAFHLLEKTRGISLNLSNVPPADPKVYESIAQADTVGLFQIESRAQMNMLPRLRPKNFYDLVIEISLVRPGPIQGDMVHPYLRRRAGLESVEYPHPDLKKILEKTYGVPLFQEQIMKMAMVIAGFTAGEADELRRAMGTWRKHGGNRLTQMGDKFRQGLIQKGIRQEFAERVFSQIEGFAEYGFPESHAASFALIAYASAYVRFYYPDVYLCAILNSHPMGFYSSHTLIYDGLRHGIQVLGIDVQYSQWDNQLEDPMKLRLGFREIKGFPQRTALAIETARSMGGLFHSLFEFIERLKAALAPNPLTKRELFCLAAANAYEGLGLNRRQAFWEIQALSLQDSQWLLQNEIPHALPKENVWESIVLDYEAQHVSLYCHPMAYFRKELERRKISHSKNLIQAFQRGKHPKVFVSGVVICRQMPGTASGVLFVTLEDEFGFINLVIWNQIFENFRPVLLTHSLLFAEGTLERAEGTHVLHVIVDKVSPFLTSQKDFAQIESHDFH